MPHLHVSLFEQQTKATKVQYSVHVTQVIRAPNYMHVITYKSDPEQVINAKIGDVIFLFYCVWRNCHIIRGGSKTVSVFAYMKNKIILCEHRK